MANGYDQSMYGNWGYGPGYGAQAMPGYGGWQGGMGWPQMGGMQPGFQPGMQFGMQPGMMPPMNPGMMPGMGMPGMGGPMPGMMYYGPNYGQAMMPNQGMLPNQGMMPGNFGMAPGGWGQNMAFTPTMLTAADDEELTQMIYDSLDNDPSIPTNADIQVEVTDGVVTLTGSVPTKRVKHAVGDAAWWIPDVLDVNNQLKVTPRRERRKEQAGAAQAGASQARGQQQAGRRGQRASKKS